MASWHNTLNNVLKDFGIPSGFALGAGLFSSLVFGGKGFRSDGLIWIAVRMALVGILAAVVRQLWGQFKILVYDAIWTTAYIERADPAFDWIRAWMSQNEYAQSQMNVYRLFSTDSRQAIRDINQRDKNGGGKLARPMSASMYQHASWDAKDFRGQVMPVDEQAILIWKSGKPIWITRSRRDFARSHGKLIDHVRVCTFRFHRTAIPEFLSEAHKHFYQKAESELLIFHASAYNGTWYEPIIRPARPWSSVILPPNIKDVVCNDVEQFLSEEQTIWYAARGIPHRRGYLLHGKPGAGKTTLATAIATKLRLDIYIINPAARGMDDAKLSKLFRSCPPGNMILIEDIDCVMPSPSRGTRFKPKQQAFVASNAATNEAEEEKQSTSEGDESEIELPAGLPQGASGSGKAANGGLLPSTVTLSGLLNAIDGVSSQEDCILFASTNHPERLDEALQRPGRFDMQVAFTNATPTQATALFKHFYPLDDFKAVKAVPVGENTENVCKDKNEKKLIKTPSTMVGSVQARAIISSQSKIDELAEKFTQIIFPSTAAPSNDEVFQVKISHSTETEPDEKADLHAQVEKMNADQTSNAIKPDLEVSMAGLQGFLLRYKTDPRAAVEHAPEWVEEMRVDSLKRGKNRKGKKGVDKKVQKAKKDGEKGEMIQPVVNESDGPTIEKVDQGSDLVPESGLMTPTDSPV